ncbi:acetyl-CoA carboxylase biotin carboxyl carrier protein [bacterium]|nr:acetyl-CoA carboxylase biotin carboxyl carrier protein [bacterium]
MDMDKMQGLIERLTGLMEAKKLDELEIEVDGLKVALRRATRGSDTPAVVVAAHPHGSPASAAAAPPDAAGGSDDAAESGHIVHSPMVGTFYRSQSPDTDVFVEVGDEVVPDTTLCIIEAMKVMNEVHAEMEGTLVAIRAENGEAVEFGQPLFVIAPTHS